MNFFSLPKPDIGLLLLRLTLVFVLFSSAYGEFMNSLWYTGTVPVEVRQAYIFFGAVAGLCLTLGIFVRITSVATFLWLLFSEFQQYTPTYHSAYNLVQALIVLVLFFTGPGQYVLDSKFFKKHSAPAASRPSQP